ncbi:transcription factor HES-5-like [Pyxicephalus adspersus]|uniref:Uncharacterized protein n=1 Tax=Pyxicephalus adspersus TaxID=30357 RepID=A0AAV2ZRG8_PYXAD|nr:TPA: hypothetical protein GDO54_003842 [Pyxicephalus adspersus]
MTSSFHLLEEADKVHLNRKKIRKPVIEKMRRDRINHSIEQIRHILEKDIQNQRQHSKLEKADILEMAVQYLRQQKMRQNVVDTQNSQDQYYHGYYKCLKEAVGFLHSHGQEKILHHICRQQSQSLGEHSLGYPASSPQRSPCNPSEGHGVIWRPW